VLPASETAKFWVTNNRCRGKTVSVSEADRDPKDGTRVRLELFPDCAANADVSMVTIEGGGHTWPGGYQYLPERFIGRTSRDIDANQIIWNFSGGRSVLGPDRHDDGWGLFVDDLWILYWQSVRFAANVITFFISCVVVCQSFLFACSRVFTKRDFAGKR